MESEDTPRLDRIEQVIMKLEHEASITARSVESLTESVRELTKSTEKLVKVQMDQALLRQDVDHLHKESMVALDNVKDDVGHIRKHMDDQAKRIGEIEKVQQKTVFTSMIAGKVAWVITSSVLTGGIAAIYFSN